jgi:hypothetical protein
MEEVDLVLMTAAAIASSAPNDVVVAVAAAAKFEFDVVCSGEET